MRQEKNIRYLREPQVFDITKLSKTTRWRLEKEGKFPKRRQISPNCVAWVESELNDWLESRACVDGGA